MIKIDYELVNKIGAEYYNTGRKDDFEPVQIIDGAIYRYNGEWVRTGWDNKALQYIKPIPPEVNVYLSERFCYEKLDYSNLKLSELFAIQEKEDLYDAGGEKLSSHALLDDFNSKQDIYKKVVKSWWEALDGESHNGILCRVGDYEAYECGCGAGSFDDTAIIVKYNGTYYVDDYGTNWDYAEPVQDYELEFLARNNKIANKIIEENK